jgi:tRNA(Ile)-lysidine synthase TilS/MesJ
MKSAEEIEALADKLFQACLFDPTYMSESFARQRFQEALAELDDQDFEHIKKRMEEVK